MTIVNTIRISGIVCLLVLASSGSPVWAGAEDDYKTGVKMYSDGDLMGAMPFVKKAADGGHAAALALYGEMVLRGGTDDAEAVGYFKKSAELGDSTGQFRLAAAYLSGEGVKRDVAVGRKWMISAADQGYVAAINAMAHAYLTGTMDIPQESLKGEEALRWIRRAAENNFLAAVRGMVKAYRQGEYGLQVDNKLADEWAAREAKLTGADKLKKGAKKK